MNPDVSRALAQVKNRLGLGPAACEQLLAKHGDASSVEDLPQWIIDLQPPDARPQRRTDS